MDEIIVKVISFYPEENKQIILVVPQRQIYCGLSSCGLCLQIHKMLHLDFTEKNIKCGAKKSEYQVPQGSL